MSDPRWSHLHADEQQRLAEGCFNREELEALKRGEDPWPKPVDDSAQAETPKKSEAPDNREPTDAEVLAFMRKETRQILETAQLTAQQRAQMWQGAKKLWRAAHKPVTKSPPSPEPPKPITFSPSSDKPDWVNTPDAVHLSLEGEAMAQPTGSPEDDEDSPPKVGSQRHPITPSVREEIERQDRWGVDWPSVDRGPSLLDEIHRREDRVLKKRELDLREQEIKKVQSSPPPTQPIATSPNPPEPPDPKPQPPPDSGMHQPTDEFFHRRGGYGPRPGFDAPPPPIENGEKTPQFEK